MMSELTELNVILLPSVIEHSDSKSTFLSETGDIYSVLRLMMFGCAGKTRSKTKKGDAARQHGDQMRDFLRELLHEAVEVGRNKIQGYVKLPILPQVFGTGENESPWNSRDDFTDLLATHFCGLY